MLVAPEDEDNEGDVCVYGKVVARDKPSTQCESEIPPASGVSPRGAVVQRGRAAPRLTASREALSRVRPGPRERVSLAAELGDVDEHEHQGDAGELRDVDAGELRDVDAGELRDVDAAELRADDAEWPRCQASNVLGGNIERLTDESETTTMGTIPGMNPRPDRRSSITPCAPGSAALPASTSASSSGEQKMIVTSAMVRLSPLARAFRISKPTWPGLASR